MTGRSTGKRGKAKSGPKEDKSVGTGDLGEISFGLVGQNGSHICTYSLTEEAQCRGPDDTACVSPLSDQMITSVPKHRTH